MEIKLRQMKIRNRPDYLFNDNMVVNIKDFDTNLLKINKLSYKGVFSLNIYFIKYISTKNLNHKGVNHDKDFLYLFLDDLDGYIKEDDGIKYLVFTPAEKNYKNFWEEIKRQIESINDDETIEYRKDFFKSKFESDDDLPLGKAFNIPDMIIVFASVLERNGKCYPQIT